MPHHLKDWIIGLDYQIQSVVETVADNTGDRLHKSSELLPSTNFPSDHAIVTTHLIMVPQSKFKSDDTSSVACSSISEHEGRDFPEGCDSGSTPKHVKRRLWKPWKWVAGHARRWSTAEGSSVDTMDQVSSQEFTLYDYWGIVEKPAAIRLLKAQASFDDSSAHELDNPCVQENYEMLLAPGATGEAAVADAMQKFCEDRFVELSKNQQGADIDEQCRYLKMSNDSYIWMLIRFEITFGHENVFKLFLIYRWPF